MESFTPMAGRKVNWVTVGPIETSPISTSMPKLPSVLLMIATLAFISPERGWSLSECRISIGGKTHLPDFDALITNSLSSSVLAAAITWCLFPAACRFCWASSALCASAVIIWAPRFITTLSFNSSSSPVSSPSSPPRQNNL